MTQSPTGRGVRRTVLDNGIRILTEKVDYVRSVSLGVWIRAGSRDETLEESGISHFLEHMVFKGTGRRSALEIAQTLESVGGGLDAFTSREHTCFLARVLGEDVSLAIDLIADLVGGPSLTPDDVELEKQVVVEEIRSLEDLPDELVHDQFARCVWHDHALKNSILGSEQSVGSLTSEKVRAYLEGRYTTDRIVVTAAGDLDHDEIVDGVRQCLGSVFRRPRENPPAQVEAFKPVVMNVRDLNQEHVYIGSRGVSYTHPDRYAVLLMASILGGGMSSRLYQSVRERSGLAYSVSSYAEFLTDSGLFGSYVAVSPGQAPAAIRLILQEIGRLKSEGVGEEELESVKAQTVGGLVIGMEGMNHRMSRLAKAETNGCAVEDIDDVIAAIREVTADDIVRVLAQQMRPGRVCLVGMGPVDERSVSDIDLVC